MRSSRQERRQEWRVAHPYTSRHHMRDGPTAGADLIGDYLPLTARTAAQRQAGDRAVRPCREQFEVERPRAATAAAGPGQLLTDDQPVLCAVRTAVPFPRELTQGSAPFTVNRTPRDGLSIPLAGKRNSAVSALRSWVGLKAGFALQLESVVCVIPTGAGYRRRH